MDPITQQLRQLGARRARLSDELDATNEQLRKLLPTARSAHSLEAIRKHSGLSINTIRHWLQLSR